MFIQADAAAYREAAGITDPGQAIASGPHRGNPELDHLRRTAIRALEIRDRTEIIRGMSHGELEARILDGDRALASAPLDVSRELRLTVQAEADAWQQSADAKIRHDPAASAGATALARHLAARREQLEAANARYETWAIGTSSRREVAGNASAELQRRELAQQASGQRQAKPEDGSQTVAEWWRQLETDLAAVDRAVERQHQAAIAAGEPSPPERDPQPEAEHMPEPESRPAAGQEADGPSGPYDQEARLDRLLGRATEAGQRFAAESAAREATAEYAACLEREAQAEPEHTVASPRLLRGRDRTVSHAVPGVVGNDTTDFPDSDLTGPLAVSLRTSVVPPHTSASIAAAMRPYSRTGTSSGSRPARSAYPLSSWQGSLRLSMRPAQPVTAVSRTVIRFAGESPLRRKRRRSMKG
jgi:hypothetical protein